MQDTARNQTTVLVTGASGRIGGVLRRVWADQPPEEINLLWQRRDTSAAGWMLWDMLCAPLPAADLANGVVLNLAGVTPGPGRDVGLNTALALAACAAAQAAGAQHVFLVSSAAVYGQAGPGLQHEDLPLRPLHPYGLAKMEMERAALDWHHQQGAGLGLTILRIGNIVGCDALIGGAHPSRPAVLDPVPGQPGGPERSYIGPRSLAIVLARLCVLAAAQRPLPHIINIAAGPAVTMAALLDAAGQPWRFGPPNPAVIPRVALSTARLQGLVPLPPVACIAQGMIDEWRALSDMAP